MYFIPPSRGIKIIVQSKCRVWRKKLPYVCYFSISLLSHNAQKQYEKAKVNTTHQLPQVLRPQTYCLTEQTLSSVGCIPLRCNLCPSLCRRSWIHLQDNFLIQKSKTYFPACSRIPTSGQQNKRSLMPRLLICLQRTGSFAEESLCLK